MLQTCLAEGHYPLTKTTQILVNAFKYDDISQGGCPPIIPSDKPAKRTLQKLSLE